MRVDRTLAVLTSSVYFVQGALGLSAVALPLYLRGAGLAIKDITTLSSITSIPWLFKPVFAAISDKIPLWGYRRKTYVLLSSLLSTIGWFFLALLPSYSSFAVVLFMLLANTGFAVTDVVTDGLVVENSDEHTTQTYQALSWGFRSLGAIVTGALGGWLSVTVGHRTVFALTGLLPVASFAIAILLRERRVAARKKPDAKPFKSINTKAIAKSVRDFQKLLTNTTLSVVKAIFQSVKLILKGDLFWFCVILLVGTVSASFSTPLFFFFKEKLGIQETLLGTIQSISWIGAVIGCICYYAFFRKLKLKTTVSIAILADVLGTLLCLLMLNRFTVLALGFITGIMAYVTLLPLMAAAARLAHGTGIEGSLFAILMSVRNIGAVSSTFIGGYIHELVGLQILILISAVTSATGLIFIRKIRAL